MAEQPGDPHVEGSEEPEETPGYKPPAQKSVDEILNQDTEDESLRKYKEALLGEATGAKVIIFPDDPRRVIVNKLALVVAGRDEVELDLSGNLEDLKKKPFTLKEGTQYRVKIYFYVQHEIVPGLKYHQKTYRGPLSVDKTTFMVGSYGPKKEIQSYTSPIEDAPTGMMARGAYTVKSSFIDDDKNVHLQWEWQLNIKKDWED